MIRGGIKFKVATACLQVVARILFRDRSGLEGQIQPEDTLIGIFFRELSGRQAVNRLIARWRRSARARCRGHPVLSGARLLPGGGAWAGCKGVERPDGIGGSGASISARFGGEGPPCVPL